MEVVSTTRVFPIHGDHVGNPTISTKRTPTPPYMLVDVSGRYRLACLDYCEFGRADFLDVDIYGYVSRRHFALKNENNSLYILDLGSLNGTYVNGQDIRGKGWIKLKEGDKVEVANVVILYVRRLPSQAT